MVVALYMSDRRTIGGDVTG